MVVDDCGGAEGRREGATQQMGYISYCGIEEQGIVVRSQEVLHQDLRQLACGTEDYTGGREAHRTTIKVVSLQQLLVHYSSLMHSLHVSLGPRHKHRSVPGSHDGVGLGLGPRQFSCVQM